MLDFLLEEREQGKIQHLGWSFHADIEVFKRVLEMYEQVYIELGTGLLKINTLEPYSIYC